MSKGFWIVIGIIALIFGGILFFQGGDEAEAPSNGAAASNHIKGQNSKSVVLLEYGDFQCPVCGNYEPIVQAVYQKYQNEIQFQFRNLPLSSGHKNAFAAARAAEAAGLQNKYWEMHDTLLTNQSAWSDSNNPLDIFMQYASQLGLNTEQFKTDFASNAVNDIINADIAEFKKTGEPMSTPTFFLNGTKIKPTSVEEFSQLIDAEIAKQQQSAQPQQ